MTRFRSNHHRIRSESKDWKAKWFNSLCEHVRHRT